MNFSIRKRIWGSFAVLILIFIINGAITVIALHNSKKLSHHISAVIDPAQQYVEDFQTIVVESKMYTTNWVFLRSNEDDKASLRQLHEYAYPHVRKKIIALLPKLGSRQVTDSITKVFSEFDELLVTEKSIMQELSRFEDYDDLLKKMEAEQIVEDVLIPQTAHLLNRLNHISLTARAIKSGQYRELENYAVFIRLVITLLLIFVLGLGIFLSAYFTKIITYPIKKIKEIIIDLSKGIINKVDYDEREDEIGEMVHSVNNLSQKLEETAKFAQAVGNRDYTVTFTPLSDKDILGEALVTMRKNIKTSEERLLKTSSNLMKRNQALEQYTYIVSHNLRAPVATIMGLCELLNAGDFPAEDVKEVVSGLLDSSQKLDEVIHDLNQILEIKQQAYEAVEEVSLQELMVEIKQLFNKPIAQGNIKFEIDFSGAPFIVILKSYLVSILYNLVSNSIKYRRQDIDLLIEVKSYKEASKIIILYKDNGKGIDMEKHRNRLFGLYQRFDLSVEGKGMGLFMIRTQVESLEGHISLSSALNKGVEFRIELPDKKQ